MCVQTMYIKEVLDIDNMIFKPLEDLKKVKYKDKNNNRGATTHAVHGEIKFPGERERGRQVSQ